MTKREHPSGTILVTGASGQVGGALVKLLAPLGKVVAPSSRDLNLQSPDSIRSVVRSVMPRWIISAGAYTAVDSAESDQETAFAVNGTAPGILGEEAAAIGAAVLHYSTDYVFSGKGTRPWVETDLTGPLGVYGSSKLTGERALAKSGAAYVILRTSWVYGATGKNFLLTVPSVARERSTMNIVSDQHGAPTWSGDLARLSAAILVQAQYPKGARAFQGIYHAAGRGETIWFDFVKRALQLRQVAEPDTDLAELRPIPSSDYPTLAKRPSNSRLNCTKMRETFGFGFQPWEETFPKVLGEIPNAHRMDIQG